MKGGGWGTHFAIIVLELSPRGLEGVNHEGARHRRKRLELPLARAERAIAQRGAERVGGRRERGRLDELDLVDEVNFGDDVNFVDVANFVNEVDE